jgi:hypothetical protein
MMNSPIENSRPSGASRFAPAATTLCQERRGAINRLRQSAGCGLSAVALRTMTMPSSHRWTIHWQSEEAEARGAFVCNDGVLGI